ncbi:hypothetical protein [Tateyamaria sp.]|uniref:hypothetical protein n=1 Tax=Tateyamaria sp. TaxID=1929288 RepID=UPI00329FACA6
MNESPHWLEYVRALGPAIIALFVAYVAYQQWQVNAANLKEKLFDKRFEVFKCTQLFLSSIMQEAAVRDETLPEFFDAVQRSRFLFGKEIQSYLDEIRKRAIKMRLHKAQLEGVPVGSERSKLVDLENAELEWLSDQVSVIFDKFEPYLSFRKNK